MKYCTWWVVSHSVGGGWRRGAHGGVGGGRLGTALEQLELLDREQRDVLVGLAAVARPAHSAHLV